VNEPKRWLDDEGAPAGVRELLRGSARARPIDEGAKARVGERVARLSLVPVSLAAWFGTKTAFAALGAAAGIATAGVVTLATRSEPKTPPPAPVEAPVERTRKAEPAPVPTVSVAPSDVAPSAAPSALPTPMSAVSKRDSPAADPLGLEEETAFLERARRTLNTDPAFALLMVREHGARFPRGQLSAEKSLIEIEALYRSGRHAEARALAEQKLASGADDLYSERVRTLLERMDRER
jgi:hypothetical protein